MLPIHLRATRQGLSVVWGGGGEYGFAIFDGLLHSPRQIGLLFRSAVIGVGDARGSHAGEDFLLIGEVAFLQRRVTKFVLVACNVKHVVVFDVRFFDDTHPVGLIVGSPSTQQTAIRIQR